MSGRRILLAANNFPPVIGGSATVYARLAALGGDRATVVAPRESYIDGLPLIGWREHDRAAPYRVLRPRLLRSRLVEAGKGGLPRICWWLADLCALLILLWQIAGMIRRENAGLICFGEAMASRWLVRLLRRLMPVKIAIYVHGEELTTKDGYDPDQRRARAVLRDADLVFAVSRFTREVARSLLDPAGAAKLVLIENGVDTARFTPGPRRADLVARYHLSDAFVFVSVCRLLEKKGVDMALHGFARVVARHPAARFVIVGTGPEEAALRTLAANLGIAGQVVFAGSVADEDLVDHYRLGDVFVMPNRTTANGDTEGFGLVFLEANACGLPVIGGLDGGTSSAVTDGANGLLVDGREIAPIAEAMLRLLEDMVLRARIAATGLDMAARSDWRHKAATFYAACDAVMDGRPPAG